MNIVNGGFLLNEVGCRGRQSPGLRVDGFELPLAAHACKVTLTAHEINKANSPSTLDVDMIAALSNSQPFSLIQFFPKPMPFHLDQTLVRSGYSLCITEFLEVMVRQIRFSGFVNGNHQWAHQLQKLKRPQWQIV